uniref:Enhancer of mRNA-decapping protein 4 n=1 Tax=Gadus morhua TaxID=8049 RepID=A0A8C5C5K6_GADMO
MASNSNIDIEGATQHLRDILKLDRPVISADVASVDGPRKTSFNGDLNGLLGAAGLLGSGDRSTMDDNIGPCAADANNARETQIICLSGDDGSTCISFVSNNVEIVASRDSSIDSKARGSNKVKIQPVAKYDWEHKYFYGNLIAVSNSFLAYAIRGANNHAMIRVLSLGSSDRSLLKGFTGAVTDLGFAHLDSPLLGCVDEAGNLVIWQLTCTSGKILDQVVVHIRRPDDTPLNSHRRLIWCPFILEDNEENQEDTNQTLALLHEDRAEVWDLDVLRANNASWPVDDSELKDGLIVVKGHTERVSEGALSPDGTVLATASHDGYVKFWQIYIEGGQNQPRCLHEWLPHSGRPVSCLLFCDNHKKQDPDVPFWRFLITGADQNQELKMWCTFYIPETSLDLSASFLILTDVQRKVLYVMELHQDQEKGRASFTAVSEFLLTHPVLSFGVHDVTPSRQRHTEVLPAEEESESMTTGTRGTTESKSGIQIKLFCVHTNLIPASTTLPPAGSSDHLTDQSSDKDSSSGSESDLRKIQSLPAPTDFLSMSDAANVAMPKLMTPDAFMTPSTSVGTTCSNLKKKDAISSINPSSSVPASPGSSASSLTIVTAISSNSDSTSSPPPPVSPQILAGVSGPLSLDGAQVLDAHLLPHQASPTRARSPDVISSASTAMSQDMPEIASQTLPLQRGLVSIPEPLPMAALQADSMASAANALHLLTSPRGPSINSPAGSSVGGAVEGETLLSITPSLLENALSQENAGAGGGSSDGSVSHTPWPAAPDITRETRNNLRDNGLGDCSREELKDRHMNSPYHRRPYQLTQNDSQDASAEQSDHDDEVASLASSSGNCGGARSSHRLPAKEWKTSPRGSPKLKRKIKKDEGSVSLMSLCLQMNAELQEELLLLLRSQQREIADLRGHMDNMQSSVTAHVEHVMAVHQEQEQRRLDRMLAESQGRQEQLNQQLSHALSSSLTNRMDRVLREEMKKTVPPTISKSLEPVTSQLSSTVAAKLSAVEATLKENLIKVVKSKNTTDAIGRAATEALQGTIQTAYKEAFQTIVLPVFDRGCQSMFQQINESFKQGTQEYIQQLEAHLKSRKQREQEVRDPVIGQLQQMIENIQSNNDQLANNVTASVRTEVQHQLQMMVANLQESLLTQVQRIVKGEVSQAMKEQQAVVTSSIMQAMRSAASTPVPTAHLDYQTQQGNILQLLQQGQLNQAFQQALSATDLNLVLYVCETIDSQQVFGQHPCPLSQPVLLSLIQQLSSNLTTRSELKISYLEDAVMNLDRGDPLTRDHMSAVLAQVLPKLYAFLQHDPHSPHSKRARRLQMMLQGLVNH